jgi:hypothetical protein
VKLYIRYAEDDPHRASEIRPGSAHCGVPLAGAQAITEKQALVYLGDRRCKTCWPNHGIHLWSMGHR